MTRESYLELMNAWIANGRTWWSTFNDKPKDWNPIEQLNNLTVYQPQTYTTVAGNNNNTALTFMWTRAHRRSKRTMILPMLGNATYVPTP